MTRADKHTHDSRHKAKARKSGPSLLKKSDFLGIKAETLSFAGYWEPTHLDLRATLHLPQGWSVPEAKRIVSLLRLVP